MVYTNFLQHTKMVKVEDDLSILYFEGAGLEHVVDDVSELFHFVWGQTFKEQLNLGLAHISLLDYRTKFPRLAHP